LLKFLQPDYVEKYLEDLLYMDCVTIKYDLEYSPQFFEYKCHSNIKFFQFQYDKTIIENIKGEFVNKNSKKYINL